MANLDYATDKSIELPAEFASEIIQKTQESSAIMQLARKVNLPGTGVDVPVIMSDPEASWVGSETDQRSVSTGKLETKQLRPYILSVIVPFSNKFRRDAAGLYSAIVNRLPGALSKKFDETVMGSVTKPGDKFDNFSNAVKQVLTKEDAYNTLVAADADVSAHDGVVNGYVLSPKARSILLTATDNNKRPLFINNVSDGAIPMILGSQVIQSRGAYSKGDSESIVGVVGDWTKAVYGTVEGVNVTLSDQATLVDGETTINLFQQGMFAVKAEIELGFRADTSVFNTLAITNA
ncbi:HK97 family phage major capsid protein [Lactobacillus colini]|uniref:HK97 family phage major capsid protein n=1 Tax=Lactobacillus colini TaxID=1819254 RepID=A0ABS4MBF6_9LACO|nr:phage major capsid protein [Lactobacillus colini]MBP2057007.1 HK97 family phage major capsid protein [Lactobacillus colini]